ncbi:hypothetical protein [Cupriavidus plantarum]|uniref:hypothetical protein n=1 Tax=Cupriavidus plantarum TaxID=942865 RepID=UPI000E392A2B|nr:hypothetical protein [Cupriavidus plantarum]REE88855.1 hypothetical protein C7418_4971 [Cupriavidus plantarum]
MRTTTWTTWTTCTTWLLAIFTVCMLAACGGGGGGSGSGTPTTAGAGGDGGGGNGGSGGGSNGGSGNGSAASKTYVMQLGLTSGQVAVGGTLPMTATVVDGNGNDVTGATQFTWSTSNGGIATVTAASMPGSANVRGTGIGVATISVVATVTASDGAVTQLPMQSASVTVLAAGSTAYALALPYPALSMTHGQVLPVTASLIDSHGADRSSSGTAWTWNSSGAAVQVTGAANVGTLRAANTASGLAQALVSVSVTAPNGGTLSGMFPVSVVGAGVASYRLVLSRAGAQINAISVLNGRPQSFASRVVRNDEVDTTSAFDGLWTFTTTSPTLTVQPDASTRTTTVGTNLANGADAYQSVLAVTAGSLTLTPRPRANLFVTEQPTWALVYNGPQPLTLVNPIPATIAVQLVHRGIDEGITGCTGWNWTAGTGNVSLVPVVFAPNAIQIQPSAPGPFSVTVTCTAGAEQMPLSMTIAGTVM